MIWQKRSCYITCKYCEEKGDSYNHKSTECSDGYPYIYKNGLKCLDDCSKEELYIDKTTNICYDNCKNNKNNNKYNYKNMCISKDNAPKNYILDENNNSFISVMQSKNRFWI